MDISFLYRRSTILLDNDIWSEAWMPAGDQPVRTASKELVESTYQGISLWQWSCSRQNSGVQFDKRWYLDISYSTRPLRDEWVYREIWRDNYYLYAYTLSWRQASERPMAWICKRCSVVIKSYPYIYCFWEQVVNTMGRSKKRICSNSPKDQSSKC